MTKFALSLLLVLTACALQTPKVQELTKKSPKKSKPTSRPVTAIVEAKHFKLSDILAFTKAEKLKTNVLTLKKDTSFNSYKQAGNDLTLSLKAFPGPERFTQLSLLCDACGEKEVTLNQTLLCQTSFKKLYQLTVSKDHNDELNTLFKQARFEEGIKIPLPQAGHEMRIEKLPLKCDTLEGVQMRVDLFSH